MLMAQLAQRVVQESSLPNFFAKEHLWAKAPTGTPCESNPQVQHFFANSWPKWLTVQDSLMTESIKKQQIVKIMWHNTSNSVWSRDRNLSRTLMPGCPRRSIAKQVQGAKMCPDNTRLAWYPGTQEISDRALCQQEQMVLKVLDWQVRMWFWKREKKSSMMLHISACGSILWFVVWRIDSLEATCRWTILVWNNGALRSSHVLRCFQDGVFHFPNAVDAKNGAFSQASQTLSSSRRCRIRCWFPHAWLGHVNHSRGCR